MENKKAEGLPGIIKVNSQSTTLSIRSTFITSIKQVEGETEAYRARYLIMYIRGERITKRERGDVTAELIPRKMRKQKCHRGP